MRSVFPIIIAAALAAAAPLQAQDAESASKEDMIESAIAAADHWLAIVDSAGWSQSYKDAAQYFKSVVAHDVWMRQIRGVRMQTGPLISRTLTGSQYATSLPNAPEGEYVIITYEASFENKPDATETVTPMKDPDGVWRVSGYYVK